MLIFFHAIVHKCLLFIYLKYICYILLMSSLYTACDPAYVPAHVFLMIGLFILFVYADRVAVLLDNLR